MDVGDVEVKVQASLTSTLDGSVWSGSFTVIQYQLDGSLGWPTAGLDAVAKRKIPVPNGNRVLVAQPVQDSGS